MLSPENEVAAEHLCSDQTRERYGDPVVTRKSHHKNFFNFIRQAYVGAKWHRQRRPSLK